MSQTMPHAANLEDDDDRQEAAASTLNAPRLVTAPKHPDSEIEAFMASSQSLYRRQRANVEQAEAAYQAERFRLTASYERKMQAIVNEAKDALLELDLKHEKQQSNRRQMMSALATCFKG